MIRLLYCIPSLHTAGGTERVLTKKANYFAALEGYEVYIVLTERQQSSPYFPLLESVKVINLDINFEDCSSNPIFHTISYLSKIRKYEYRLSRLLEDIRPDIVTSLLSHEIDFLYRLKDGSKKIGECHFDRNFRWRLVSFETKNPLRLLIAKYRDWRLEKDVARIDYLVTLTDRDNELWRKVKSKSTIPNSLPFLSVEKSSCQGHCVMAVGRLAPPKGFDILLRVWRNIERQKPEWHLHIYGDGEERLSLERYIVENKLRNVHLEGSVSNLKSIYKDASFLVVSSRSEGFSMVVLEAIECGLPVVTFDCPYGPGDILTDGVDGFVVELGDLDAYEKRILQMMEQDELRKQMGVAAAIKAKKYTKEKVMQMWQDLYANLLLNK